MRLLIKRNQRKLLWRGTKIEKSLIALRKSINTSRGSSVMSLLRSSLICIFQDRLSKAAQPQQHQWQEQHNGVRGSSKGSSRRGQQQGQQQQQSSIGSSSGNISDRSTETAAAGAAAGAAAAGDGAAGAAAGRQQLLSWCLSCCVSRLQTWPVIFCL